MLTTQVHTNNRTDVVSGLAVDIDDTLAASVHRWMARLDEEFPAARYKNLEDRDLTIDQLVSKYTFAMHVPYWSGVPEIHSRLVEIRTNPEEILAVEPIEGAVKALSAIHQRIPVLCYFSTRPQSLYAATSEWLKQSGFPSAELILTPDSVPNSEADRWKVDLIAQRGDIGGIIDNSSDVVSLFPDNYQGVVFHFGVDRTPLTKSYEIIPCPSWERVERAVSEREARIRNLTP